MKKLDTTTAAIMFAAALGAGASGNTLAATTNPGPFTGCLAAKTATGSTMTKGQIYNVSTTSMPTAPCLAGDAQVSFGNATGPAGAPGTPGAPGAPGTPGAPGGPSDAYHAEGTAGPSGSTVSLPAGNYAITLTARVPNQNNLAWLTRGCEVATVLVPAPPVVREIVIFVPPAPVSESVAAYGTMAFTQTIGDADGLKIICESLPSGATSYEVLAVKVGSIHEVAPLP